MSDSRIYSKYWSPSYALFGGGRVSHSTGGVPLQYSWYMYTVLTFRPEYQYPLYIVVRRRRVRFCARVKARFSVQVFGLKKLFWKHTTRTFGFCLRLITDKKKKPSLQRFFINFQKKCCASMKKHEFWLPASTFQWCFYGGNYIGIFWGSSTELGRPDGMVTFTRLHRASTRYYALFRPLRASAVQKV